MHILVLDDSPLSRAKLRRILEAEVPGSKVLEAWDGKSALHELATHRVDFIVSDLNMPKIGGLSFLELLKKNPYFHQKKILVFSSEYSDEILTALKDHPNVAYLEKNAGPEAVPGILIAMQEEARQAEAFSREAAASEPAQAPLPFSKPASIENLQTKESPA